MIYGEKILSKTELYIPIFLDQKPFCSKYDPMREAAQFSSITDQKDFFLIGGLGSGFHILELSKKFPDSRIMVVENSDEDINFCFSNFYKELSFLKTNNIEITTIKNIEEKLIENYIPACYSTFAYLDVKSWTNHIDNELLIKKINSAMKKIGADFSVQAHFGKIWQKNILENLKLNQNQQKITVPTNKIAAIIAAGPTLDSKINLLKEKRKDYYIISTDTGYKSLLRNNLYPDCVVSVDGQNVSHRHFMKKDETSPIFVLELTADNSTARKLIKNNRTVIFSVSQHPFEVLANKYFPEAFITIDSSSGTVTIAALDFARKAGFRNIQVFGADFGYPMNKAYAKGTYLDDIYSETASRISTTEKLYSGLMFRTELKKINGKPTTETLETYKNNLLLWCKNSGLECLMKDDVFLLENKGSTEKEFTIWCGKFPFEKFIKEINSKEYEGQLEIALLPLIAWLKNKKQDNLLKFNEYCKLARNYISRYNF